MVDTSFFGRLQRLFSTDVIIRNVGGNQLKVMDTDRIQQLGSIQTNSLFDRYNKVYTTEYETAVIIKRLSIDNINIIPEYTHCAEYNNDHGFTDPTSYIGFNGKWALTFDRPFYQWLHQAHNQGWLIG